MASTTVKGWFGAWPRQIRRMDSVTGDSGDLLGC